MCVVVGGGRECVPREEAGMVGGGGVREERGRLLLSRTSSVRPSGVR